MKKLLTLSLLSLVWAACTSPDGAPSAGGPGGDAGSSEGGGGNSSDGGDGSGSSEGGLGGDSGDGGGIAFAKPDILDNASFETGWDGFTNGAGGTPNATRDNTLGYAGSYSMMTSWTPNPNSEGGKQVFYDF